MYTADLRCFVFFGLLYLYPDIPEFSGSHLTEIFLDKLIVFNFKLTYDLLEYFILSLPGLKVTYLLEL